MPELSRFFGIVIMMYFNDHEPLESRGPMGTALSQRAPTELDAAENARYLRAHSAFEMIRMNVIWVTHARALPAYRLWVQFSDGAAGEVALERFVFSDVRPIVAELRDPAAFARLRVQSDTVTWDNGFDLAPEFLYEQAHTPS